MTREEAIAELSVIWERLSHPEDCENGCYSFRDGDYLEALDMAIEALQNLSKPNNGLQGLDLISRQAAIDAICKEGTRLERNGTVAMCEIKQWCIDLLERLPSAQPEKETARRVLWTGWKGTRDTRYKCPNCKKPVKNDDVYCHRCGQKLMFPHISFTDYIPGEKQELIVRWDDE